MKPGSKKWKNLMAKLYGIGAAVVIIGALFKIQHWPLAGFFLIAGLSTEAIIFFFSAFEPPHEDPDWSLVYPELATGERAEGDDFKKEDQRSVTEQLDDMLEAAKIEPELIQSLGQGMRSLSDQARQMGEITGAAAATSEYADSLKGASAKVSELSESYARASE
ncbi:MAG: gliding motility protein GldL, partial [Flavobacteriales bacterium]|nr:gliding motility protein GldL [Flavobacteriales bacterium]